jgi:hypothetical protein
MMPMRQHFMNPLLRISSILFSLCLVCFSLSNAQQSPDSNQVVTDSLTQLSSAISTPRPVGAITITDVPNDAGHALNIVWELSPDDETLGGSVRMYRILKGLSADGPFFPVSTVAMGISEYTHTGSNNPGDTISYVPNGHDVFYRIDAVTSDTNVFVSSLSTTPGQSSGQWFHTGKVNVLIALVFFVSCLVLMIKQARSGKELYIRPIGGIEAVDDAIGRATEMGRPVMYLLGAGDSTEIATIASFTILSRVAKRVAEFQSAMNVPCYDQVVMSIAQEVVRTSYLDAGRPDSYSPDMVHFLTNSQFAYVTAVNGIMVREKPATNLMMGKFFAESLIFAETGSTIGAVQIAGTDEIPQIPFFVVACDYTLIGEELYAASAYLGREPVLLGSLKAQDYTKGALIILAILVMAAIVIGQFTNNDSFLQLRELFRVAE